jgi:hypothetical protein
MKIRSVGAELLQANGQTNTWTYMIKLTAAFHNFVNVNKNPHSVPYCYSNTLTAKLKCSTLLITKSANGQDPDSILYTSRYAQSCVLSETQHVDSVCKKFAVEQRMFICNSFER